jgi:hypothetical protein
VIWAAAGYLVVALCWNIVVRVVRISVVARTLATPLTGRGSREPIPGEAHADRHGESPSGR